MERVGSKRNLKEIPERADFAKFYGADGIHSFVAPASPAPNASSSPTPISRFLSSLSRTIAPSVFYQSSWSSSSTTKDAAVTLNGPASICANKETNPTGTRHVLRLDAYLNSSSDEDEDDDRPIICSSNVHIGSRRMDGRPSIPNFSGCPTFRTSTANSTLTPVRKPQRQDVTINLTPTRDFPWISDSPGQASTLGTSCSSIFQTPTATLVETPVRLQRQPAAALNRAHTRNRSDRKQCQERRWSFLNSPSRNNIFERPHAYNSETKRILRDLERAEGRSRLFGNGSLHPSNRALAERYAAGFADAQASNRELPISQSLGDGQAVTRLAALGPSLLYRALNARSYSSRNRSRKDRSSKADQVTGIYPSSIVSSGPVFRFAKPYPVNLEKHHIGQKRHAEPSLNRFGNTQSAALLTPETTTPNVSYDQSAKASQKGRVRFSLPAHKTRSRAGGDF